MRSICQHTEITSHMMTLITVIHLLVHLHRFRHKKKKKTETKIQKVVYAKMSIMKYGSITDIRITIFFSR